MSRTLLPRAAAVSGLALLTTIAFGAPRAQANVCLRPSPPAVCEPVDLPPTGHVDTFGWEAGLAHWRANPDVAYHQTHPHSTTVAGWAFDPETTDPVTIRVYDGDDSPMYGGL